MVNRKVKLNKLADSLIWTRLLGGLFIVMALAQIITWEGFNNVLYSYRFGPEPIIWMVAASLISLELLVGWRLQTTKIRLTRLGLQSAIGLESVWLIMIIYALVGGIRLSNSGFFGSFLAQPVTEWILIEMVVILIGTAFLLINVSHQSRQHKSASEVTES